MTKVSHASHSPSIFTPVAALPLPSVVATAFILLLDLSHAVLSELRGHPLLTLSAAVLSPVHPRFVLVHTPYSSMPAYLQDTNPIGLEMARHPLNFGLLQGLLVPHPT